MNKNEEKTIICPVCGRYEFEEDNDFDICTCCGWENDGVQEKDHNYAGGANELSVNEARIEFFLLNDAQKGQEAKEIRENYFMKRRKEGDDARVREEYMNKLNRLLNCYGGGEKI
ncbi:MAG: hypothetical protein IJ583_08545 [Firmicutes bacterium]|nr:hypothetical protein [Bacillota bacterium]